MRRHFLRLTQKVALVTGSSAGIGKGIATSLLKTGAAVVLNGRRKDAALKTQDELASAFGRDRVHCVVGDVSKRNEADGLIAEVLAKFGRLDILVNNAGIEGEPGPLTALTDDNLHRVFETNVYSQFYLCRAAIPHFAARFEKEKSELTGSIVLLSSVAGKQGVAGVSAYVASNWARLGLMKTLAVELAPLNVTVNALCPGIVWTPMLERVTEMAKVEGLDQAQMFRYMIDAWIPMKRPQTIEDMGQAVVFMTSAPNFTGQDIVVDGGHLATCVPK
eukprot:RCo016459